MLENPMPSLALTDSAIDKTVDTIVVGLAKEGMSSALEELNQATDGWIDGLINDEQVRSAEGELTLLASPFADGPRMILVVGLGESLTADYPTLFRLASTAVRHLSDRPREKVVFALAQCGGHADGVVAGAVSGCQGQAIYQADRSTKLPGELAFLETSTADLARGEQLGLAINQTKLLVNGPAGDIYPESFADRASEMAQECGIEIEVWDEERLEKEGCRAILAVGQGSDRPPRLVIMRYNGGGEEAPLAIVGKGVTFDSGGLSIKPSAGMVDMKCDMAGAATVFGVIQAVAKLGIKKNVIGLCGLAENMVSGNSYKLGDVVTTRSGKTIEILNTDAEGRVVLSDTLDVAIGHQPRAMVDLATLTGACMVALGTEVAGLMTNDESLCESVAKAADEQGEWVWQLPMFDLYDEKIKSKVADIKNIGEGRWGGAITAAKLLEQFVGDVPWVHIDIAGPAFADSPLPHRDAGATGVMVRTLVQWIENY